MLRVQKNKGFSIVEVLVAAAIISASSATIFGAYALATRYSLENTPNIKAAMLLEEGAEALKVMRDSSWTKKIASLSLGTSYRFYFDQTQGTWLATTSVAMIDKQFDRAFTLSAVGRDSSFNVLSSGG